MLPENAHHISLQASFAARFAASAIAGVSPGAMATSVAFPVAMPATTSGREAMGRPALREAVAISAGSKGVTFDSNCVGAS